jgi:ubiquitin-conjugating enzyme E2 L3
MVASRRLLKELEEIRKCGMKNIQVDEANLSTWQGLIVPDNSSYDKGAFRIDINFPADYPLNHPRSHLKQRSTTLTSMRRGGSVCQSLVLKAGSQPPRLTK